MILTLRTAYTFTSLFYIFLETADFLYNFFPLSLSLECYDYAIYTLQVLFLSVFRRFVSFASYFLSIPLFFWNLLQDEDGRSIREILCNPRYENSEKGPKYARSQRSKHRKFRKRRSKYLSRLPEDCYVHSCYQTKGAFKHVEVDRDCETFIATGVTRRTFLEILLLYFLIPYTFIRRRIKKPPKDGYVSYFCSVTSYLAINSILVGIGISRIVLFR